jgi:hypothetical protein
MGSKSSGNTETGASVAPVSGLGGVIVTDSEQSQQGDKSLSPGLPKPIQHGVSARWTTFEALRILQDRLRTRGQSVHVLLFTAFGIIQGKLADFSETYEHSIASGAVENADFVSAVVHLRTDLWSLYSEKDGDAYPVDSAALLNLEDVVVKVGARRIRLDRLGVFAGDVIAFTLTKDGIT